MLTVRDLLLVLLIVLLALLIRHAAAGVLL